MTGSQRPFNPVKADFLQLCCVEKISQVFGYLVLKVYVGKKNFVIMRSKPANFFTRFMGAFFCSKRASFAIF